MTAVTVIKSELYRQGGLEKYTWQIAAEFCAVGAHVTVLTTGNPTPPFSHPLLNVVSLPVPHHFLSFLNVILFDKACADYLKKHPTPIIFSLDRNRFQTHIRAGNGVHAAYLDRRSQEEGKLKALSFALNPLHHAILSLEKKGFEHPHLQKLFTNSEMVKREILKYYATDPQKIQVVHNGVEWKALQAAFDNWPEEKDRFLKETGLERSAFQFLFVGHNFHRKGLGKLLEALSLIKEEHFQLNVVGKEKEAHFFKDWAKRLGLEDKIFFWGVPKSVIPFYQSADCMVIPSLYDPFANVTVEALALGVRVLSSKNNGGHEILTPLNGSVIDSLDDITSFAQTLRAALDQPKTENTARLIRGSVSHLDFSLQLRQITTSSIK